MHFVINCICAAIFCLTTSSLSARSSVASYSRRAAVFRRTTSSHSAAVFSSAVSFRRRSQLNQTIIAEKSYIS